MKLNYFLILIAGFLLASNLSAQRFVSSVFDTIQKDTSIVYGNADYWDDGNFGTGVDNPEDITLDLYQPPAGDTMSKRPLVIAMFGGAFMKGSPDREDIVAWCDSLAHYGYVAAAIDYRIGFNPAGSGGTTGPDMGLKRAAWRAIQDGRASVRFFKEMHDTYNIDTNQIFVLGNSAGAITAFHVGYMNSDEWIPEAGAQAGGLTPNNVDLGCIDCSTSLSGHYDHSVDVAGIISLWGATLDLNYIEASENIPTMMVHGTDDGIVPYDTGSPFNMGTGWNVTFTVYGSLPIHERMDSLNIDHVFYPYPGEGHTLYSCGNFNLNTFAKDSFPCQHWPQVFNDGIDFLAENNIYANPLSVEKDKQNKLTVFPNPANDKIIIKFDDPFDDSFSLNIYDISGKRVFTKELYEKKSRVNIGDLNSGVYFLRLRGISKVYSKKIVVN